MGSMDSSRIGQFFGLSPKMANPADNAGTDGKGGFADLLFGVMSKRVSTAKPALSATRVSTVLPMAEGPANVHVAPPLTRKLEAARLPAAAAHKDDAAANPSATGEGPARVATSKCGADKQMIPAEGVVENQGELVETAPPAEGAASEESAGDDVDLEGNADGSESENSDVAQEGTEQAPDQTATAIVVEPQITVVAAPDGDGAPVVAPVLPASAPVAPDGEAAMPAPAADGTEALAAAQPPVSGDDGQAQAETATPTAAAAQSETANTPAQADTAPADAAPVDDSAVDQTAFAALALAADLTSEEAEAQVAVLARQNDRRGEDVAAMFRRPAETPRQRAAAASAGTTGTPVQAPATNAVKTPAVPAATAATTTATTALPLAPIGFDTGLGSAPGVPGWTLNLAQGALSKRPDFIANLRQHLQNLPAHEQMALGIQRSARDGGGRITLQLSPTELGRIHLKLDIDEEKNVRASVSVERPATLELLQRDTKALERALQDAGLKMDQNDLSFSLHGGDSDSFAREFGGEGRELTDLLTDGAEGDAAPEMLAPAAVIATGDGLVDVQI